MIQSGLLVAKSHSSILIRPLEEMRASLEVGAGIKELVDRQPEARNVPGTNLGETNADASISFQKPIGPASRLRQVLRLTSQKYYVVTQTLLSRGAARIIEANRIGAESRFRADQGAQCNQRYVWRTLMRKLAELRRRQRDVHGLLGCRLSP